MATAKYGWQQGVAPDTMHLQIAGWTVELRASPSTLAPRLAARYAAFAAPVVGGPDLLVEVESVAADGESGSAIHSLSVLQTRLTIRGDKYLLDSDGVCGMIEPSRGRAALRARSDNIAREVEYFLRIALALFALPRSGLLIHGAALKRSDSVYLFVGQSGSGKSTVVALSQEAQRATALGDDLVMIRQQGDLWQAYGTPFWNLQTGLREGQGQQGRVAHIYKLIQDRAVYVEPMGRAAATAELLANCPIVNDQATLVPDVIERCRAIASSVPVERLHFCKDDSFWDVVG